MARPRYRSFAAADEIRPIPKGVASIVSLGEATVARSSFDPGWRWSTDLAPVRCAAAMTRSAMALGLAIRVGIHTGEVEFVGPR